MDNKENKITDTERLLKAMEHIGLGEYDMLEPFDESDFDDSVVAQRYNELLKEFVKRNNHYLLRVNEAQSKVGDSSALKIMLEEIVAQQTVIKTILNTKEELEIQGRSMNEANGEFLALTQQIDNTFIPCLGEIKEVKSLLSEIEIPDKQTEFYESNKALWDKIEKAQKCIGRSEERLSGMGRRIADAAADARELFDVIEKSSTRNETFLAGINMLSVGYKSLQIRCLDLGKSLYEISKDFDLTRTDIYRHNSKPSYHDALKIFEVDHITLTWRMYNNILDFDRLKLTDINNPAGCKFAIWYGSLTDQRIIDCVPLKNLLETHKKFHAKAVECFEAKKLNQTGAAMDKFAELKDLLVDILADFENLHKHLRTIGEYEDEEVWKIKKR